MRQRWLHWAGSLASQHRHSSGSTILGSQPSMAAPRPVDPVLRICAIFSRYPDARAWAIDQLQQQWGKVTIRTPPYEFEAGGYYKAAMGPGLEKLLVGFAPPVSPEDLADWKNETNEIEDRCARELGVSGVVAQEPRPLNLDPGYVTQAKLVLATTKDRDHRVYLCRGIFAEVTLSYTGGAWVHHRWTYPDYRDEPVTTFVESARRELRRHLQSVAVRRQA